VRKGWGKAAFQPSLQSIEKITVKVCNDYEKKPRRLTEKAISQSNRTFAWSGFAQKADRDPKFLVKK
jgi:hypothetical protein